MAKVKISRNQKESSKNIPKRKIKTGAPVIPWNPEERLGNEDFIGKAILECLLNNDPEGVMEIVEIYIRAQNKRKLAQEANISRATMYHNLKAKNPTIKTLAKYMHYAAQQDQIKRK